MADLIQYLNVPALLERGSGVVRYGTAPDGLPLLTAIDPPPRAEDLLVTVARALGVETTPVQYAGSPLEGLASDLNHILHRQMVQRLTMDGRAGEVLVVPRAIRRLCGATLLERLFGGTATTNPSVRAGVMANTGAVPLTSHPYEVFKPGETCLAFPVAGDRPMLVRKQFAANGWPAYQFSRPFVEESLGSLGQGTLLAYLQSAAGRASEHMTLHESDRYRALRQREPLADWRLVVPRTALGWALHGLMLRLDHLHRAGEVHGDVKPANVLLTRDGCAPIDSLLLEPGSRSPALTRSWAAPEQVLCGRVSPQTDQYPIGLLLIQLVQGVLYGEEARVSIPTGGRNVEFHTVLRNPGVYIDPDTAPLQRAAVESWRSLAERCAKFDSQERYSSMKELAAAIEPLLREETLLGQVEVPLSFGLLVLGEDAAGSVSPCWLAR